jgi:hypothetical protein
LTLTRWQTIDAVVVLCALAEHAKQDVEFRPRPSHCTTRWHASVAGVDYEILCTGPKFLDTRANQGGGGAIDLAMHLLGLNFKQAVSILRGTQL